MGCPISSGVIAELDFVQSFIELLSLIAWILKLRKLQIGQTRFEEDGM